jgi:hypothetical protein
MDTIVPGVSRYFIHCSKLLCMLLIYSADFQQRWKYILIPSE